VLSGDYLVINGYLVRDLISRGLWNDDMRNQLLEHRGSIQSIKGIPDDIKELYKTAYEMSMKTVIDQARGRAPFVCQSQSMNLFLAEPSYAKISAMLFYSWSQRLKTMVYYCRTKAKATAAQFTVVKQDECVGCSA